MDEYSIWYLFIFCLEPLYKLVHTLFKYNVLNANKKLTSTLELSEFRFNSEKYDGAISSIVQLGGDIDRFISFLNLGFLIKVNSSPLILKINPLT